MYQVLKYLGIYAMRIVVGKEKDEVKAKGKRSITYLGMSDYQV